MGAGRVNAPLRSAEHCPWENEYWRLEPLFAGKTVFCVASGPSLTAEISEKLRGRHVAVVNSTCKLMPWADVMFFTDNGWYDGKFSDGSSRADFVRDFPGLVLTMSKKAKREQRFKVKRIEPEGAPEYKPRWQGKIGFPPVGTGKVWQGRSSGHTLITAMIAMGAECVALVAYDMRLAIGADGKMREHFHDEYKGPRDLTIYENEFVKAFTGWNEAAAASGVRILNCTPGSAITEFPFADLDEVIHAAHQ
jgi:hypothetical protein